jgi:hypothetical protein
MAPTLCVFGLGIVGTEACAAPSTEGDWRVGSYRVTIRSADDKGAFSATLKIRDGGRLIYKLTNAMLRLNPPEFFRADLSAKEAYAAQPYKVGSDILKLGGPTLVVQGYSLGAHCCFDVTILYLGDHFRAMPTIPLFDAEVVRFHAADGHKALAMTTQDFTFGYWRAPFVFSSAAPVTLSFDPKQHRYVPDANLMRAPLPKQSELDALAAAARDAQAKLQAEGQAYVPREVTQPILDLIYAGHLRKAQDFLVAIWAGSAEARDDYWSDLTSCQLRLSPFWPTVARINGLRPEKPVGKCPRV